MIPGSANPLLLASTAGAAGYVVERSIRLNSADSAYLSRTPASAGNRKTWTWAGWVKNTSSTTTTHPATLLFARNGAGAGVGEYFWLAINNVFTANGHQLAAGDGNVNYLVSTAFYRDPSAWYHIACAHDSTQATAANRLRLYVNGAEVTAFNTDSRTSITQNSDGVVNRSTIEHRMGLHASAYSNCYLADIHFIDGQALDPTSFGEFNTNGVWQPKAYTGTYGTNGFRLDFADNSAATTAGIGKDVSGNGNDWTPNNLSVAAGAGNDSLVDTPTSYGTDTGAGGEVRGNYATLNPLDGSPTGLSNGNLDAASANAYPTIIPGSGQWYYEVNGTGYQWDGTRANWTPRAGSHNFGQRAWLSSAPSGYKALCTANLPEPQTITTSGTYTGNGVADGPFVYLNGVPTAMTVNGNAVTFGTEADKLSNGFKVRTTSPTYNQNAVVYNYSITSTGDPFKRARAQSNP